MTIEEVIKELDTFKRLAKSESGEKALDMAIAVMESYDMLFKRLGHLPFRVYKGKEMVDRLDIYDTLNEYVVKVENK